MTECKHHFNMNFVCHHCGKSPPEIQNDEFKAIERDYLKLRQEHSAMKAKLEIAKEALEDILNFEEPWSFKSSHEQKQEIIQEALKEIDK